jgi:hypothetical protein
MDSIESSWFEDVIMGGPNSLKLADYEGMGRGLFATQQIKRGQLMVRIPYQVLMDEEAALRSPISGIIKQHLHLLNSKVVLALFLLYENQKRQSFWRPYLDALPKKINLPIYWKEEELEWLQASSLRLRVEQQRQDLNVWHATLILPILKANASQFGIQKLEDMENYSLEKFFWAFAMITSRAFWNFDPKMEVVYTY